MKQNAVSSKGISPLQADLLCLLVAVIWGGGFIVSEYAIAANMSSALIIAGRFVTASVAMMLVYRKKIPQIRKEDLKQGIFVGIILFLAFYTQIMGQAKTTVSHCAFLTATNVVIIPFLVWIIGKKRPSAKTFLLAGVTLAGVGILTYDSGEMLRLNQGDGLVLLCALLFAMQIFFTGEAVRDRDPIIITMIQLATAAVCGIAVLLLFERDALRQADFAAGTPPVLALGIFSTFLCYLLQTYAQKYTHSSRAGILLSTEGLFGSLFSVLMGMEPFTASLACGGAVILSSVILLEVPFPSKQKVSKQT